MQAGGTWPLVSAAQMRALDAHTIDTLGVPGVELMERAGRAIVDRALARGAHGQRVVAVCATGNNGGDGFVAARLLHERGVPVEVALVGDPARTAGDARSNLDRLDPLDVPIHRIEDATQLPDLAGALLIDALFGTGLVRPIEGLAAACVAAMNAAREQGARVIAADIPSGVCSDTGSALGTAVWADETVTMGLPKLGLCQEPGRSRAGRIFVARIGIADRTPEVEPNAQLWSRAEARAHLPVRGPAAHKGSFGHLLVVAGSEGKSGAAHLAAVGAQRAGAGLVTVACPASLNPILEVKTTEAMTVPVAETQDHGLASAASKRILELASERGGVALGPGIGQSKEAWHLVRDLALTLDVPLVIDADGLNAFADEPGSLATLAARSAPTVLTPHPGEAGRLLDRAASDVNADRPAVARELAATSGSVVVLKGAGTVIAEPSGNLIVNPTGGPALAAGGTGDVLTGVIAAYLVQGVPAFEAAALGVYVHGLAGDLLTRTLGESGILAAEVAAAVPRARMELLRDAAAREVERDAVESFPKLLPFPDA